MASPIPNDVALTILSKLPLKCLKRFTCVHKSWPPLLENPFFMNMFRTNFLSKYHSSYDDTSLLLVSTDYRNLKLPYFLSGDKFENIVKLNWSPPFQGEFPCMIGSCIHGIFCLQSLNTKTFVLWNPATQEFKFLPHSPLEKSLYRYYSVGIRPLGFGYDPVRDDFKLIRHLNCFVWSESEGSEDDWQEQEDEPMILNPWEIYSLRSNSWRKLDMPFVYDVVPDVDCDNDMYMNGVCHWFCLAEEYVSETHDLASFNLSNEVFCITPLPLDLSGRWVRKSLVALNESIAVILKNEETASFHIWVLGELGVKESWTKLFIVGPLPGVAFPIGVGKNGDIFFRKENGELVFFDLSTNMLEEIATEERLDGSSRIRFYKESLIPIGRTEY